MRISLLKLIDVSILPSVLVFCLKYLGVVLATYLFNLSWSSSKNDFLPLALVIQSDIENRLLINSFSQIFASIGLVLGLAWLLIAAHNFHETHLPPSLASKLERNGLSFFVVDSFSIFHRSFVWLALLWLIAFLSLFEAYTGEVFLWVSVVLLTIAAALTYVLALDLDKEKTIRAAGDSSD